MTQTVPATAALGPGKTGLAIGLRVLNLDGTTYAAFATTGVSETNVAGTYRKAAGVVCPDAGAYIVWGVSGTDYAEATVEPVTPGGLTAQETRDAMKLAPTAGTPAAGSVDAHLDAILAYGAGAGSGTGTYTDTVTNGVDPLDNVLVQLSTDAAGTNMVYRTYSAADGTFTLYPDPGTYYVWLELAGYSFTQGAQVVVT